MTGSALTVVIPVWDSYCELLPGAVDSARQATAFPVSVLVVDNASATPLPALPDGVQVLRAPRRLSTGAARNLGLAAVSTPLVLFLDADDRLLAGAIERLAGMLERAPGAVAAVGKQRLWNPLTGEEKTVARAPRPLVRRLARHPRLLAALTLRFDCYPLSCAVIRTTAARDAGGFGDTDLAEDWMLRSALAFRGAVHFDPEPSVRFCVRAGSLWHRAHSRDELEAMYRAFAEHRRADPALPGWARGLLPVIARAHRREARRRTRDGDFRPADHGLVAGAEGRQSPGDPGQLSVIVCTHERPEHLTACLEALAADPQPPEVVVVDSGSSVPCSELVEGFRDRIPQLHFVSVPAPGLSRARNAGIARSTGSIVAFLDDDAVPLTGWREALVDAFAQRPGAGCVGGACLPSFAGPRPRWLSDRLLQLSSITRFGDVPREPGSSAEWPFGANMAFRREALDAAGSFSEALGRTGNSLLSGEDSDMVARVLAAGWRVWLEPRAAVLHTVHAERLCSRFYWRRLWWAGISRAQQPRLRTTLRLLVALPVRTVLWTCTGDRMYLYRLAESAGYLAALGRVGLHAATR